MVSFDYGTFLCYITAMLAHSETGRRRILDALWSPNRLEGSSSVDRDISARTFFYRSGIYDSARQIAIDSEMLTGPLKGKAISVTEATDIKVGGDVSAVLFKIGEIIKKPTSFKKGKFGHGIGELNGVRVYMYFTGELCIEHGSIPPVILRQSEWSEQGTTDVLREALQTPSVIGFETRIS
jgi:hypothetical protein